jgi:hypothetical protein
VRNYRVYRFTTGAATSAPVGFCSRGTGPADPRHPTRCIESHKGNLYPPGAVLPLHGAHTRHGLPARKESDKSVGARRGLGVGRRTNTPYRERRHPIEYGIRRYTSAVSGDGTLLMTKTSRYCMSRHRSQPAEMRAAGIETCGRREPFIIVWEHIFLDVGSSSEEAAEGGAHERVAPS